MDWNILGIAPTDDKKAITAAYRQRLRTTNPEDKPEEFKALRAAYEEALRLADQGQAEPAVDDTPVGRWAGKIAALYNDFPARIDLANWEKLLHDEVCAGLDTRADAEEALIRFLMEHYYIPRSVWQVLDEAFSWLERYEELCESWPRDFVDQCIVNGVKLEQRLTFDGFIPGTDAAVCDEYRRLYYEIGRTPYEERGPMLDKLESMSEQHILGRALRCHWLMTEGREEEARDGFRILSREMPNDAGINTDYAMMCVRLGDFDEAEAVLRRVLELEPGNLYTKQGLAEALAGKGQLKEAKETLYEVMHGSGDDPVAMDHIAQRLREWNLTLIGQYRAALEADPGDTESAVELAWCYLQNEEPDEAMQVALTIDEAKADPYDYHNLLGKLYHNIQMFPESAEHMERVVAILREMKPDGTEKTAKRLVRLPEMLQVLGNCYQQTGRTEEAMAVFTEAMTLAPDDARILTTMGNIHFASGEYDKCVEVLDHMTEVSPGSWFGHFMQAMAYAKLRRDREAFDAVNRAMSLRGPDLSLYVFKMQILLRNGVYDEVRDTLQYLHDAGAPEDISVDFIRAQLLELEQKDEKAAFEAYQAIARKVEEGDTILDAAQLYFHMAKLMGKKSDVRRKEDREVLLAMIEKGLSHDPRDADCLSYKAWLLKRDGRLDEAIEMYKSLNIPNAKRAMADLYYSDLRHYGAEALKLYEELMLEHLTPELCYYAARCCHYLGDNAKAEHYTMLELELDPDDIDAYVNLAYIREEQDRTGEALEHLDKAVAIMWQTEQFYDWLIEHRVKLLRRLGRHGDALAAIDEAMDRADYDDYGLKFEICCQFGLWDQAEAVLAQWARAARNDPEQVKATGKLHLYRGKMLKATFAYAKVKHQMEPLEELELRIQLSELEANHKRLLQLWQQREAIDNDTVSVLMNHALVLRWSGELLRSKSMAQKALERLEEELASRHDSEALHRTRRSVLLALVGRMEEARAELANARKLPLCSFCAYGRCKDADVFEAYIEEIAGNTNRAKELYQTGRKNWPDELDFVTGETRLKKKKG